MKSDEQRATRTRRLIEWGGLIDIAGLADPIGDNRNMLLGALLEQVERLAADPALKSRWLSLGTVEFRRRKAAKSAVAEESGNGGEPDDGQPH